MSDLEKEIKDTERKIGSAARHAGGYLEALGKWLLVALLVGAVGGTVGSLFHIGVFSNRAMNKAFLAGMAMQLAVLCLPPFMNIFSVTAMTARQWGAVLGLSLAPVVICEAEKSLRRRKRPIKEKRETIKKRKAVRS